MKENKLPLKSVLMKTSKFKNILGKNRPNFKNKKVFQKHSNVHKNNLRVQRPKPILKNPTKSDDKPDIGEPLKK